MNKVSNVVSLWENGQSFPHDWPVGIEENSEHIGSMILKKWNYRGLMHEHVFEGTPYNRYSFAILPDETGFVVINSNSGKNAYILNGDATIRFILAPAFNMRKLDSITLIEIRQYDVEQAKLSGRAINTVVPREKQVSFHYKTERNDALELFGDDGFGDCYYTYDWNTGDLLLARTLPRRS